MVYIKVYNNCNKLQLFILGAENKGVFVHSIGSLNKINISQANIKPQKIINYFNWGYCVKHTRGRNSPYKKQEAPIDLIWAGENYPPRIAIVDSVLLPLLTAP